MTPRSGDFDGRLIVLPENMRLGAVPLRRQIAHAVQRQRQYLFFFGVLDNAILNGESEDIFPDRRAVFRLDDPRRLPASGHFTFTQFLIISRTRPAVEVVVFFMGNEYPFRGLLQNGRPGILWNMDNIFLRRPRGEIRRDHLPGVTLCRQYPHEYGQRCGNQRPMPLPCSRHLADGKLHDLLPAALLLLK